MSVDWHIVTCEYPPAAGGVADYTFAVAAGLAAAGDGVHVWCPRGRDEPREQPGVSVHPLGGRFGTRDLRVMTRALSRAAQPRRLLVQWVPHGYGRRAMNVPFCVWLWRCARQGETVELMVHEPYLQFHARRWKQSAVALVHRVMTALLLGATRRAWVAVPRWEECWRPFAMGRRISFRWLPVPSNIPVVDDTAGALAIRKRLVRADGALLGHFGRSSRRGAELLAPVITTILSDDRAAAFVLVGDGSDDLRAAVVERQPRLASRVHATGRVSAVDVSLHLRACDVVVQPYEDGISTRRTTAMAALAHGCPMVTTRGWLTEPFWESSEAAVVVPVAQASSIAPAVRRLLTDADARRLLGAAGAKLYAERFDIRHTIDALRDVRAEAVPT